MKKRSGSSWFGRMSHTMQTGLFGKVMFGTSPAEAMKIIDDIKGAYGASQKHMENAAKSSDKIRKNTELAKAHAKDVYKNIELGGQAMQKLLKDATGAGTYEPPVVKMGVLAAFKKRIASVAGIAGAGSPEATMAQNAVKAMTHAEGLMDKAVRGEISPNELATLMYSLRDVGAVGTHLSKVTGPGVMSSTLLKNFQEKVLQQVAKLGEEDNRLYSESLMRMTHGTKLTPEGVPVPGGAIPGSTTGELNFAGRKVPLPWTKKPVTAPMTGVRSGPPVVSGAPNYLVQQQGFSRAPQEFLQAAKEYRQREEQKLAAKLMGDEVSRGVKQGMTGQVLKVQVVNTDRDPMSSQGGGNYPFAGPE